MNFIILLMKLVVFYWAWFIQRNIIILGWPQALILEIVNLQLLISTGDKMGTCVSKRQKPTQKHFTEAPTDSSSTMGNLTRSRFLKSSSFYSTSKKQENILLNQLFDKFDRDSDGYLNLEEIQAFLKHLYRRTKKNIDQGIIVSFINNICDAHSQRISREEFILFYKRK